MSRRIALVLGLTYLAALAASHVVRRQVPVATDHGPSMTWPRDPADPVRPHPLTIGYGDHGTTEPGRPPIVVLHGSPAGAADLEPFAQILAARRRVLVPDLPGSGRSTRDVSSYSFTDQAMRLDRWLDGLGLRDVHLVGYSMGGGIAITMTGALPPAARIRSLTLLSSIGVQQMELFGDYEVNHFVHGTQLALLGLVREGVPHFGWLDSAMIGVPYARTFYDSDQRPLAAALARTDQPVLILHGSRDPLVPLAAAREHARLLPQAELRVVDSDHFLVMRDAGLAAQIVAEFLDRVDAGRALARREASPERAQAARAPFDPRSIPPAGPVARAVLVVALAGATLVSEDLACVSAGVLVAQGQLGFLAAAAGCWIGIVLGDTGLYFLGRLAGTGLVSRRRIGRVVASPRFEEAVRRVRARGAWLIAASRFVPGTRVATCVAAGILGVPVWPSVRMIALAALVWTPLLVGMTTLATGVSLLAVPRYALVAGVATALVPVAGVRRVRHLISRGRRRRCVGWWMRVRRWEFWPPWILYASVIVMIARLAIRHRSPTVFTAVNPGMPAGGFVGESKSAILLALTRGGAPVAPFTVLRPEMSCGARLSRARAFRALHGLPLVLKPDQGQRGAGVRVLRTEEAFERAVASLGACAVLQVYVAGPEFGVFYARHPDDATGRVVSLTAKRFPTVVGDGRRTVAALIDDDDRAVALAGAYRAANASRLEVVPARGEPVTLCELGSHCRGAIFVDGAAFRTDQLEEAVERSARAMPGFSFGRFDVRAESERAFEDGRFTILELNGVTSEPTHIYDPACSFRTAVRTLAATWALAFEIGAIHARSGARVWTLRELLALAFEHRRFAQMAAQRPDVDSRGDAPLKRIVRSHI